MINPQDISNYNNLSASQKKHLEQEMQNDELHYLSTVAFEKFKVNPSEIKEIFRKIDQKTGNGQSFFYPAFIVLLSGLLIGVSIFFIIFQKSKIHPSVYEPMEEYFSKKTLDNKVAATDTVFNAPVQEPQPATEHYDSKSVSVEEIRHVETYDMLSAKTITLEVKDGPSPESQELLYIPNAPVIFISNLKITNYHLYYFKESQWINLSIHTGLPAQYEKSMIDPEGAAINKSDNYMAHKIIQRAMRLFDSKNYTACIEELNRLIAFNPDDANAQFYLGMCLYLTDNFVAAQSYFQKNRMNDNNIFYQESEFYQAMCLLNTKKTDEAIALFLEIVKNKGFYSKRAQEIVFKNN